MNATAANMEFVQKAYESALHSAGHDKGSGSIHSEYISLLKRIEVQYHTLIPDAWLTHIYQIRADVSYEEGLKEGLEPTKHDVAPRPGLAGGRRKSTVQSPG